MIYINSLAFVDQMGFTLTTFIFSLIFTALLIGLATKSFLND